MFSGPGFGDGSAGKRSGRGRVGGIRDGTGSQRGQNFFFVPGRRLLAEREEGKHLLQARPDGRAFAGQ